MRSASAFLTALSALTILSCGSESGDPHSANGVPPPGGKDERIRDVNNPTSPGHAERVGFTQAVSGAIVVAVDTFDEAQNGKSAGTIYVQDLGSKEPYSGISLFAPTFNPGNLRVSPGDVLDLRGEYQENKNIGTAIFAPNSPLPQFSQPIATFRYETAVPAPVDITVQDLAEYTTGRKWMGMLVRISDVTLQEDAGRTEENNGRLAVDLLPRPAGAANKCESPFPKVPEMTNDLFDVGSLGMRKNQKLKSITGVVGYFCSIKIAPRSAADIVMQ